MSQHEISSFAGFSPETFELLLDAEADPSAAQLDARQPEQELYVRGPMVALCAELAADFGPAKVYNLHRSSIFWKRQVAVMEVAREVGYVLELTFDGLVVKGGWWKARPGQMEAFRREVASDPAGHRLEDILTELKRTGWTITGNQYIRVPAPFPPDHHRGHLMRFRNLVASFDAGRPEWLETRAAVLQVKRRLTEAQCLVDWLEGALTDADPR
jgi:uncharacterized protein (DUF2461 family)